MPVRLINHACCKVETDGLGFNLGTEGSAFNAGRDLLIATPWLRRDHGGRVTILVRHLVGVSARLRGQESSNRHPTVRPPTEEAARRRMPETASCSR